MATLHHDSMDKKKVQGSNNYKNKNKNKKGLPSSSSDSLESISMTTQPHMPSSVYNPNPFPLDPVQPDGVSRHNAFSQNRNYHQTQEGEALDIEIEETKGFVSGKSRRSIDDSRINTGVLKDDSNQDVTYDYELANRKNNGSIQKISAGLKETLSNLTRNRGKACERENVQVDAVLQHNLQQQQKLLRQQRQQHQLPHDIGESSRGRDREPQHTQDSPLHGGRAMYPPNGGYKNKRGSFVDSPTRSRLHSLSPPPPPGLQDRRSSGSYWPDDEQRGLYAEQSTPFIGYQPPPFLSSSQDSLRSYQRPTRPLSLPASEYEYEEYSPRQERYEQRYRGRDEGRERERCEPDGIHNEGALSTSPGVQRQAGLGHITTSRSDSALVIPSEFGNTKIVATAAVRQNQRVETPDRLSRAKEWVANQRKNNHDIAAPTAAAMTDRDREAALSSIPDAFRSSRVSRPIRPGSGYRLSMDSADYRLMTSPLRPPPPRGGGSYLSSADRRYGYGPKERIAAMNQIRMHEQQQEQQYRNYRANVVDDGRHWDRRSEEYYRRSHQNQHRGNDRVEYEGGYGVGRGGAHSGFHGYPPGGPDDINNEEEFESTLVPVPAAGSQSNKKMPEDTVDLQDKSKITAAQQSGVTKTAVDEDDEEEIEDQLEPPKKPNKRRLILRLISLFSSVFVLVLLIAASPVSKSPSPFSSQAGLAFHYIVAILSMVVSFLFVFNYLSRRLRRREKMKRYILFGLDILMTLIWFVDIFICISKFPCAVGGQNGWCDMYNSSVFLGMIALMSFLIAFLWDIWGSLGRPKIFGEGPWIKPPPPGFDGRPPFARQGTDTKGHAVRGTPGGWPAQSPRQGFPTKPKNSKALW
ncbi:hypothetical protein BX616_005698 [Lobosporangium transversale]|uniref:MARVEL domain-containing protein n=1 Tax=Lobosporangium transversale TaxID=64571 RepID=A0A1Y2H0S6_9FUNG|nr:hypothetical protein BCR41DRAFT_391593 [Lobosporangium transversale]KAF9915635.1 hypothetical protein BX616_005698 [Lobosporangium transversale]ORZ28126.1 hypothetical protein BCR41DRAFT_391593 [Lobosporangium transversale]|eukprot:XP_021885811.1 hypothetical protein BCR41DRAFT_391593 [Lobosporangium transversale]